MELRTYTKSLTYTCLASSILVALYVAGALLIRGDGRYFSYFQSDIFNCVLNCKRWNGRPANKGFALWASSCSSGTICCLFLVADASRTHRVATYQAKHAIIVQAMTKDITNVDIHVGIPCEIMAPRAPMLTFLRQFAQTNCFLKFLGEKNYKLELLGWTHHSHCTPLSVHLSVAFFTGFLLSDHYISSPKLNGGRPSAQSARLSPLAFVFSNIHSVQRGSWEIHRWNRFRGQE